MSNSLSAVHPELIAEWSDKNLPLTPDSVTFGSNKKVWWKGACGHEWETSIKARSNGEKCPICSGARVIEGINDLSTLKPELAFEWSEKNEIKPTEVSIGSHKRVIWKCKLVHEWTATVKSRTINGTGCPYCSHNKVLAGFNDLATLFPKIADEWSDKNEKKANEVMAFANSKAWWKCKTCGYEWNTLISTRSYGSKCPCCNGYVLVESKNDLKTTHPNIAEEWSEKNSSLQPDEVNAKSRKNVWWHCKKCGNEWKSVINARVKGTVCPVCAERAVLAGYNDLATTDREFVYNSPLGKITMASSGTALTGLWFDGQKYFADNIKGEQKEKCLPVFAETAKWLDVYFSGKEPDFMPDILITGTPFRKRVAEIMLTIPYGKTMTYGEIASIIANEKGIEKMSARAVGGAVGHNLISIIIPCHRIVGTNGSLTGYAGGIDRKIALLNLEKNEK